MMSTVPAREGGHWIYRHSTVVRITHWLNALCILVLVMSGLQIFNAHPALYWGNKSTFETPAFAITAEDAADGTAIGRTTLFGHSANTTGLLGVTKNEAGMPAGRAFPSWATLPSRQDLATGRRWHFFFAWILVLNGLFYIIYNSYRGRRGHIWRDLVPSRFDLNDIGHSIRDHIRLKFPHGAAAIQYNVLQKISYLGIVLVVFPVLILAGLTMSPGLDAAFPWLLSIFNGRQTARTIHFIAAFAIVLFVVVHVVMVLISGVRNNMRSMITGYYDVGAEDRPDVH